MIAERAGLPKANLHYYFPTKLALYRRVLDDLFEDWHRAAGSFEADDDPVEAIGAYVRAKMALSRRRPLGSKVWANEIIHGAEHMQDILSERVKPWFDTRVKVIDGWIARGLLAPVDAHALMYLIWSTTQHYADFDAQIRALSGKRTFTQKAYDEDRAGRAARDSRMRAVSPMRRRSAATRSARNGYRTGVSRAIPSDASPHADYA